MDNERDQLQATIASLEQAIAALSVLPTARAPLEAQLAEAKQQLAAIQVQSGGINFGVGATIGQMGDVVAHDKVAISQTSVTVSDAARVDGVVVGVNLGRIVYGRDPLEDERRRLVWYLDALAAKLAYLPLRGLEDRLAQGQGIALPQVYVMMATQGYRLVSLDHDEVFQDRSYTRFLKKHDPDFALPNNTLRIIEMRMGEPPFIGRATLATEAVVDHQHLVLLGDPGSGKSTFVRHLAWALAQRGLDQLGDDTALFGWNDQKRLLPILLPLRALAGALARDGLRETTVFAALRDVIQAYCPGAIDDLLIESLRRGKALLLFDGLDEVPLDGADGVATRQATLEAIREFTRLHPEARAVVTCRTRAFDDTVRTTLGWQAETLAPFTLGQMRHFVPAWYNELVAKGQITSEQRDHLSAALIYALTVNRALRAMGQTPLLLTMMTLVLYTKGELPRDRPQLYERILELLLGQWDQVRDGQSLTEAIGLPEWGSERIRPLLDELSYKVHLSASSIDGRGRIERGPLYTALIDFFKTARVSRPGDVAMRWLDYIEQRSGLLVPDDSTSYVLAHVTLQEHCAGRHLLHRSDAPALVARHRSDDRWREPILLGLGVVQQYNPALIDRILTDLIDRDEDGKPKDIVRWYRDMIFAAEIGADRDWNYLRTQQVQVDRLQRDLKRGLLALLADKTQPLPVAERVRAGFLLGDLGDPRYPVTIEEWRHEIERALAGDTSGYLCRIEAGTYTIGSPDDDPDAKDTEKPQHQVTFDEPFWMARLPITNDQWRVWAANGDEKSFYDNDSNLNHPNQPVVGVSWNQCFVFCVWLSEQLGVDVRLPTEQQWEAAARGHDQRRYPWGNEWHDDHAATKEDRALRGWQLTVPVGCYPAGANAAGMLDLAGNVWEWCDSIWKSYPDAQEVFATYLRRVLRGGNYSGARTSVRCGARARIRSNPGNGNNINGFRVVVAPRRVR